MVGHPRSFALFDSPARVPRADRFDDIDDDSDDDVDSDVNGDNSDHDHSDTAWQRR